MIRKFLVELLLAVSVGIVIFILATNSIKANRELSNIKSAYNIEHNEVVKQRKINDSTSVYYMKTNQVSLNNAKVLFKDELDAFKQQTSYDIKNLQSFLKTHVNSSNHYTFNNIDTTHCDSLELKYSDKYSVLNVHVKDGVAVIDTKNYMYLTKYTYKTRNNAKWYTPWKWGKHLQTEVKSDNPKDSITEIKEVIINGR